MSDLSLLFLQGFSLSAGLIMAIGAQNAFVLRLGLQRHHVLPAVLFCAGSDAVLMISGGIGFGSVVASVPLLITGIGIVGTGFLSLYGLYAARRALHPGAMVAGNEEAPSLGRTLTMLAVFTYLNPHVYLDTIILVGGLAGRIALPDRLWFLFGASFASLCWFVALGFGARLLAPVFAKPMAWRVLDMAIAVMMWALAIGLAFETLNGFSS